MWCYKYPENNAEGLEVKEVNLLNKHDSFAYLLPELKISYVFDKNNNGKCYWVKIEEG